MTELPNPKKLADIITESGITIRPIKGSEFLKLAVAVCNAPGREVKLATISARGGTINVDEVPEIQAAHPGMRFYEGLDIQYFRSQVLTPLVDLLKATEKNYNHRVFDSVKKASDAVITTYLRA